jgi:hypothetical protein
MFGFEYHKFGPRYCLKDFFGPANAISAKNKNRTKKPSGRTVDELGYEKIDSE